MPLFIKSDRLCAAKKNPRKRKPAKRRANSRHRVRTTKKASKIMKQKGPRFAGQILGERMTRAARGKLRFKPKKKNMSAGKRRYRVVITAKPGTLLRGGVSRVTSSWFSTKREAEDYRYGMRQPNIGTSKIEASGANPRRAR